MNPQTTFQPLYTRHVSGCIIVASTSNPKSLERAYRWKEVFDKKTKVPDEPSVPTTIFINHDHVSSNRSSMIIQTRKMYGKIVDDDVVNAERASDSDLSTKLIKIEPEKSSPRFAKSGEKLGEKLESYVDSENIK
jgi:hypothetical protein